MLSFSAIHMLLVIITFICGLYSIRDYRYTYKRLTGMLYILAGKFQSNDDFGLLLMFILCFCISLAASLLVCIEVLSTVFRHASDHLPDIYPADTTHSFGTCYILAWLVFIQLLGSSFAFFFCSKKRKGFFDQATEEEAMANVPIDLGRF